MRLILRVRGMFVVVSISAGVTACGNDTLPQLAGADASTPDATYGDGDSPVADGAGIGDANTLGVDAGNSVDATDGALTDVGIDAGIDANGSCALAANTTTTSDVSSSGCAVRTRDTSACSATRASAGLSGYWLKFSCRVTLTKEATTVNATSDGQPDYPSNYFTPTNPCYDDYTAAIQNPNLISAQSYEVAFALTPDTHSHPMQGTAIVGLAINGVPIYGNFAAPGDDIYQEAKTFDRCGGHPQNTGDYHYHAEPYAISDDDDNFIGVMRDGYPIYGRRDPDGTLPTVDATGGHTGVTVDSPSTPVYHYHVNLQTSTASTSSGQTQWFLTTGTFRGTPAACSTCN